MPESAQTVFCRKLMDDGSAFTFLGQVMEDTAQEDYLPALTRAVYLQHAPKLNFGFSVDTGTALILLFLLEDDDKVVRYEKKEVGALIRFPKGSVGNATGIALVEHLLRLPSIMELNDAQILELESLLNKAGETLGISLPTLRHATEEEQKTVLMEMAFLALQSKPKLYYQIFLDIMKANGTPVDMTQQDFWKFAEDNLRP